MKKRDEGGLKRLRKSERKKRISIFLEPSLIDALRNMACDRNIHYQTMIREWLWERIRWLN